MGLNVPLVFDEMHGNNVSNCPTFIPIHCNLNARPKVQCKPSCVGNSLMLLGFLVSCLMHLPNVCNVMWGCNFGCPIGRLIPLLFAKQLSNSPLPTACFMSQCLVMLLFSYLLKHIRDHGLTSHDSSTIWQTTLPTKEFATFGMKKKCFQLYLATWTLILTKYEHHWYIHAFNYIHSYIKRISL